MLPVNAIIVKDPDILGGTPVFRGTRVPFQALLDYLEGGQTLAEFLDDFPTVTRAAAVSGLAGRKNGELLSLAERNGFRVFLSLDKGCSVTNKILRNGVSQSLSSGHGQTASPISWLMPKLVSIK